MFKIPLSLSLTKDGKEAFVVHRDGNYYWVIDSPNVFFGQQIDKELYDALVAFKVRTDLKLKQGINE